MNRIFEGTDLTYNFRGNIIVVKRRIESEEKKEGFKIVGKVIDERKAPMPGVTAVSYTHLRARSWKRSVRNWLI